MKFIVTRGGLKSEDKLLDEYRFEHCQRCQKCGPWTKKGGEEWKCSKCGFRHIVVPGPRNFT